MDGDFCSSSVPVRLYSLSSFDFICQRQMPIVRVWRIETNKRCAKSCRRSEGRSEEELVYSYVLDAFCSRFNLHCESTCT